MTRSSPRLRPLPRPGTLRAWHVCPLAAWETFQADGVLRGNWARITEPWWEPQYRWLTDEMRRRLPNPPAEDRPPVWVYIQAHGTGSLAPDLRRHEMRGEGETTVRLTLDLDPADVLQSDLDLWGGLVLNDAFIPLGDDPSTFDGQEAAYEAACVARGVHPRWDARHWEGDDPDQPRLCVDPMDMSRPARKILLRPRDADATAQLLAGWGRIFDLAWSHPDYTYEPERRSIQGTCWELRRDQVRRAEVLPPRVSRRQPAVVEAANDGA